MPRRAFSLIELLVVLGLLVVISTIGVAAFSGTRKVSRLVGTEQLISGMIRQARMTARATGQAVMLYVDPDTRSISGVSRLAMWQSDCETTSEPFTGALTTSDFQTPFGRSGAGFANHGVATVPKVPLFDGTAVGRNRQLTRRPTAPTEGFQLGAVVKALQVYDPDKGLAAVGPGFLPLLVIGDADANTDKAFAGLVLRRAEQTMYTGTESPPQSAPTPVSGLPITFDPNPKRMVWEVVGWVLPKDGTPQLISSLSNAVKPDLSAILPDDAQRLDPTIGGIWMEISLVYTGNSLELHRDGRLIAVKALTGAERLAGYGQPHNLFIGTADIASALGGSGPITTDAKTVFDDIQLVRLGVDQPQVFPGGVVPKAAYRILIHPDGRIASLGTVAANPITWQFTGVFDEKEDVAQVDINPTSGTISASNVKLSASAP